MNMYRSYIFNNLLNAEDVPEVRIQSFHWEKPHYSRPDTFIRFFAVKGMGYFAQMRSCETPLVRQFYNRDDNVYKDSCLEVFISPVPGRDEYINFEMNPNGAYLSEFGVERAGRVHIKELCDIAPRVKASTEENSDEWGVELFIPEELIAKLYQCDFHVEAGEIKGNFYKCADDSPSPHYGALFPVGSSDLGFHNPAAFGRIIIDER